MKFEISHVTRYQYEEAVMESVNELRLTPRTNEYQSCYHHAIAIEPNASLYTYEDFFGNRVHSFSVHQPHKELLIKTKSTVVTKSQAYSRPFPLTPKEEQERIQSDEWFNRFAEYLLFTRFTTPVAGLKPFMNFATLGQTPVFDWVKQLVSRIHASFIYDPKATHVQTEVGEFLELERGVCQDFSHFMITVCRRMGIPARYVSGYNFVGDVQGGIADFEQASHAWVEVYIPDAGWYGFDPTNNTLVGERYVKLGHGRDYTDIVPVKGVYFGNAKQRLEVVVDVQKMDQ